MAASSSSAPEVADLVASLGTDEFSTLLHAYLEAGISATVLFAYAVSLGKDEVDWLLTETESAAEHAKHVSLSKTYADGDFREDPLIPAIRSSSGKGPLVHVRRGADLSNSDFRERYYGDESANQELSIVGDGAAEMLYVGFCGAGFSDTETHFAAQQAPLVLALLRKHRQLRTLLRPASFSAGSRDELMRAALLDHPAGLTLRESEVCAAIVKGYGTDAIALNLGISPHTVATHRKRAYAKFRISSQAELFAQVYTVVPVPERTRPSSRRTRPG